MAVGALGVLYTAFLLGRREQKRIGVMSLSSGGEDCYIESIVGHGENKKPKMVIPNLILVLIVWFAW